MIAFVVPHIYRVTICMYLCIPVCVFDDWLCVAYRCREFAVL